MNIQMCHQFFQTKDVKKLKNTNRDKLAAAAVDHRNKVKYKFITSMHNISNMKYTQLKKLWLDTVTVRQPHHIFAHIFQDPCGKNTHTHNTTQQILTKRSERIWEPVRVNKVPHYVATNCEIFWNLHDIKQETTTNEWYHEILNCTRLHVKGLQLI